MDRNSVIGFVLIFLLLIAYIFYNTPSQEENAKIKHRQDSIALLNNQHSIQDSSGETGMQNSPAPAINNAPEPSTAQNIFKDTAVKAAQNYSIENELIKVILSNKGGKVVSVELKKYKTSEQRPLILFNESNNKFNYVFFAGTNQVETNNLLFQTIGNSFTVFNADSNSIIFRAYSAPNRFIEQKYTLRGNSYLMGYQFSLVGMDSVIRSNNSYLNLEWQTKFNHLENDLVSERNYSSVYFRYTNEDVDEISEHSTGQMSAPGALQWVAFKQHFFNCTLITKSPFDQGNFSTAMEDTSRFVKNMTASLVLPYKNEPQVTYPMQFYFGPNNYQDLKKFNNGMQEIIPIGVGIFYFIAAPINKYFIIPIFNFLSRFNINYGVIILLMTLALRLILSPFTYRSFVSAAKMKVIKPELDQLREKYKDDQAKFGQEQLKLFKQAGVNPIGGCLPLLLQLPILAAMYSFFPSSIELRQQSFLWAKDLSTYDSVANLNFAIPFYGSHVSLFTLIMTASSILFALYNNQLSGVTGQMKWMTYLMPLMLLGIFNSLPAALTYYYTLTNIFSFIQQWVVKNYIIDETAIHRQIQENKKKPVKKSRFQQRLEEMTKSQQQKRR
ncbi:MAG: membrane protein insertase YidC [Chitinophagales bacterium]|nr:membrane protein insertase YidC [Chitinophagales bacterium]